VLLLSPSTTGSCGEGGDNTSRSSDYWSYHPIRRPAIPSHDASDERSGAVPERNPIDAFILAEQARHGLISSPPADPAVLLRRVYLDLIGVPPTRAELQSFLADPSDAAYERQVNQLLANPLYGERWGRHWMDVWRYSDWYGSRGGNEIRYSQRIIWRWRDWIVESLSTAGRLNLPRFTACLLLPALASLQ